MWQTDLSVSSAYLPSLETAAGDPLLWQQRVTAYGEYGWIVPAEYTWVGNPAYSIQRRALFKCQGTKRLPGGLFRETCRIPGENVRMY